MQRYNILWADDEIDMLKPHILFLEGKGNTITPVNNGAEAIEMCENNDYDVVFLDENMPGMNGLETLNKIKNFQPNLPVVMITKNEEESIMEEAIGAKIADYLIKPINPSQILLSMKRILENKRLVTKRTNQGFQQEFREISDAVNGYLEHEGWMDIYKKMVYWDLEIDSTGNNSMTEVLKMQRDEANANFGKFIGENYGSWINDPKGEKPLLSHRLMEEKVLPLLNDEQPLYFILIDNLRYDQWKTIEPYFFELFTIDYEESYYSILPTTTAYSRNSIFSGMLPLEMESKHPEFWVGEDSDEGKNNNEKDWLEVLLRNNGKSDIKYSYQKIKQINQGKGLVESIRNLKNNVLNVIVYNFVDMLSHARTDMAMIRELAPDESAYRSITKSWFEHSPLYEAIQLISELGARLIITTDHGTIRVKKPFKIVGDRNTNTNLRYKVGKNLSYKKGKLIECRTPEDYQLPKTNISSSYVFAMEDQFFAYPNNYNHYVNHFRDTFQHGGVSLEEMIIPIISLNSKHGK